MGLNVALQCLYTLKVLKEVKKEIPIKCSLLFIMLDKCFSSELTIDGNIMSIRMAMSSAKIKSNIG